MLIRLAPLALLALLAACASPATPTAMVAHPTAAEAPFPPADANAFCVGAVTGGEPTNPLWVSKVDNAGFHSALEQSLQVRQLLATSATNCRYAVNANLLGLSQPSMGFDLTVTAHVNYTVGKDGTAPILAETVTTPYTAAFGDSPIAIIRLRLANEGAIRTNIAQFLDRLRTVTLP